MRVLRFGPKSSRLLGLGVTLLLVLAVACGTAATPTPVPTANPTPRPTVAQVAPPAPVAAPTRAAAATPVPTAIPVPAPTPTLAAAPVVSPGKVTWMVASFGNERFNPALVRGTGHDYARQVHAFLISSDVKDGRRVFVPGIATKWEISRDGLTWTLTIRKGVKFHDGTELTTEDVLWDLQHAIGPQAKDYATNTISLALSPIMDRIEQTGPDRVSVTTKAPVSDFPPSISEATGVWTGVVYPKRATLHNVEEEKAYDKNPIGAGIMKLVKHVPAASMTFERFADYYYQPKNGLPIDKRVNFTVLDLRQVPEEATRVAALRAGEADIAPISLPTRKQVEAGGGRLVFGQEGIAHYVRTYGCFRPQFPCNDKRVRQALAYAIDKQLIQNQLFGGAEVMQVRGWGLVTPSSVGYSPELDPFPFDPVKARQLLADAGYPGGKGFGKLVINTWVSTGMPFLPESAQLGADFWKRELGLDVEVRVGDQAALAKAYALTETHYGQVFWRDNETRIDASATLRSSYGSPTKIDNLHNDPELFALVTQTLSVFDAVEREKVINSTNRRMRDEAYDFSVGYLNVPWGVGPRIRTWEPYPLAFYPSALHTITLK